MIKLIDIALRRGTQLLFEQVNLEFKSRDKIGLVGDNGSGKTSLFSLLTGHISADQGEITIPRGMVIAHGAQETPSNEQSALDYVLDGHREYRLVESALKDAENNNHDVSHHHARMDEIDGYSVPARASKILSGLGFHTSELGNATRTFSGGWRVRLNLGQALMCPSDLLLLDEPTNHLDLDTIVWLEDWLKKYQGTLVIISHDREFIDSTCKRIVHIENRSIRTYTGNFSQFEQQRAERLANEQSVYERQQKEVAHMESFINRFKYKASKARQAQSRIKALERMQLVLPAHTGSPFQFAFKPCDKLTDPILKLENIDAGYGAVEVLKNINLTIASGDRIGLLGPNGAGKSTLIKVMAEEIGVMSGHRTASKLLRIGYFAQHQLDQLDTTMSPMQQFQSRYPQATTQELRKFLGGFNFRGERVNEVIGPFSGGEKARLALALIIYDSPNILLLDEPTNHLDMEMRHALSLAMQEFDGAIILVSHDRSLINSVTDQLWLIRNGRLEPFNDDMNAYLGLLRQANRDRTESKSVVESKSKPELGKKERRQMTAQLRQQLKPKREEVRKLETEMQNLQEKVDELDKILSDPQIYETESTANLANLMQKKSATANRIKTTEDLWYSVTEELEKLEKSLGNF